MPVSGGDFSMINSNLKSVIRPFLGPARPDQSCGARTRRGTACQKPPLTGKTRCRLHGGLSTGPRTAEGKARIAAAHWKHGRRSKAFTEARKQIWADLHSRLLFHSPSTWLCLTQSLVVADLLQSGV